MLDQQGGHAPALRQRPRGQPERPAPDDQDVDLGACHGHAGPLLLASARAGELGPSGYTHFALRDADGAGPGLVHRYGLTTDDYTPKPAFATMRRLVERLSV